MKLKQIIEEIRSGVTNEDYIERMILNWLSHRPDAMELVLEALNTERKRNKELLDEMGVRLSINTFHMMNYPKDEQQRAFLIEETKKFYTENKAYVKTKGVKLWSELP